MHVTKHKSAKPDKASQKWFIQVGYPHLRYFIMYIGKLLTTAHQNG